MKHKDKGEILDVAIVGAGVSGVYSGWRMLKDGAAKTPPRIAIFEGSDRIGGRLLSLTPPGMPATRCEFGGMRYMSRHVLVNWLVEQFHMATEPMPVDEPSNIAYLRGEQFRLPDLHAASTLPYRFRGAEKHVVDDPANSLLLFALQQIVPTCLSLSHEALLTEVRTATFQGTPLHQLGFWNVLARVLSPDGYAFVRDTGGYDCLVSNWSAADAIPFILADFGTGVTYSRFQHGYDQMPQLLAREFEAAGGQMHLNTWLRSFDAGTLPDGSQGVLLKFGDGSVVPARKLVLAMPRHALELLEPTGAVLDPRHTGVRALIESVKPIPLFKIFLCYDYPWWEAVGVRTGRSITDLPIRQCYYWGNEPKTATSPGGAALLASYDDDLSVSFWEGLRKKTPHTELWESQRPQPAAPATSQDWSWHQAPVAMVEEAHRQLMEMHGLSSAPAPFAAAYRDWTEDPYGGGVNFWQIHARSWEVMQAIVHPRDDVPVYICGEAYSQEQGWVEGALQTAEIMLQKHFHLSAPPPMVPPESAAEQAHRVIRSKTARAAKSS